ncbi:iron-siderophore ABC transporter substrate-binding protein [Amycolatopsis sp. GM8]|uniref:ABC transporter substrate-binding protein n=1 Tax=Amycolatopsis sp. GM8 TaxID=2896530 RepID=UPI001F32FD56|nr:iron-siderophore ABC transporter substrate-binding protein [Amycolatopsis sp. GM8]
MRYRRTFSRRALPAVVLGSLLLVAGCGSATPSGDVPAAPPGTHTAPRTVPAGMGSPAADGVFPRTVAHFEGTTEIKAQPQRVVVISTGQADALLTLGVVPAGSTRGDGADLIPHYLLEAFPAQAGALSKVADVGSRFTPSIEAIAAIAPDLILMNVAGKDSKALYDNLSKLAPTVATQGTGLYWKQDFLLTAAALGKTQQAQGILDRFHHDATALGTSLPKAPSVSFLRKNGDRVRVFGVPSFTGSIAEDAGLARPASQQFSATSQDISPEELDRADADWIFYGVQGGAAKANTLSTIPLWSALSAVQNKHAVAVDDDVFYLNTGPAAARAVLTTLSKTLQGP